MTKQDFYHDFLLIRRMKAPTHKRARMLTELLSLNEDHWQVIGITEKALDVFVENNFKRVSRMGINRSHLVDRHKTYTIMLDGDLMSLDEWWKFYRQNDKTILATSAENTTNNFSRTFEVDPALGLFKQKGFAWSHKKPEIEFLQQLHEQRE